MIGFNELGKFGRLGNQMFQFAALKGIARNRGFEFCIPPSKNQNEYQDHQLFNPFKLLNTTDLNVQTIDPGRPTLADGKFSFNEDFFNGCPDWVNIQGYFQTEKYFKHIRDELLGDFQFKDEIRIPAQELVTEWKDPVALHVRRTDYVTNPNHSILMIDYYREALKKFDSDRDVIIFSDEPQWCLSNPDFEDDRFLVSETGNNYMDLCLMSLCNGHIIANSSFSWWGAWLAKDTQVVAPDGWFNGSNNRHLDISDIIPENWEKIPCE